VTGVQTFALPILRICEVRKVKVDGRDVIRWEYATDWVKAPFLVPKKWQAALAY
jgi:hypothetical protein